MLTIKSPGDSLKVGNAIEYKSIVQLKIDPRHDK